MGRIYKNIPILAQYLIFFFFYRIILEVVTLSSLSLEVGKQVG